MDSFAEPHKSVDPQSFTTVQEQVLKLEEEHRARGIKLSGRILHVCHYLPVTAALASSRPDAKRSGDEGLPSPPATPPAKSADIPASPVTEVPTQSEGQTEAVAKEKEEHNVKWAFSTRYGHAALNSGIHSLASTHEQIIIGWTGDLEAASTPTDPTVTGTATAAAIPPATAEQPSTKLLTTSLGDAERAAYETQLQHYLGHGDHDDAGHNRGTRARYVPVWLDDKQAHGHYEGYCKQSESSLSRFLSPVRMHRVARLQDAPMSFFLVSIWYSRSVRTLSLSYALRYQPSVFPYLSSAR